MSDSFQWNRNFETGIRAVDEQHHHLVDLINKFSELVIQQHVTQEDVVMLFAELNDYTHYHFREEEDYMDEVGLDEKFIENHKSSHRGFIEQLAFLKEQISLEVEDDWEVILDFLYQWLGHHILGQDKSMARQVDHIRQGMTPARAMELEQANHEQDSVEPLLQALGRMFDLLVDQNRKVSELNLHLEEMVKERTNELELAYHKLQVLAMTDTLTGLPNRRHALQQLEDIWEESVAQSIPLSVMMIDADYFKEVNDAWGHDAGDHVLTELARTLKNNVRNDDDVCRLGGDEFFIICRNTGLEGCLKLAELLLETVINLKTPVGEGHWNSSISIGVAERDAEMNTFSDIIKRADESVYLAKEAGRGCVRAIQQSQA